MATTIDTPAQPPRSRADISRENGAKSRGPKTPEGKARSSMNALKDGVFAKTVILPGENLDEFQALLDAHIARHQPDGEDELHLVYTMALCQWQERRVWKAETAKLEERLESNEEYDRKWDKKDADRHLGDAFNDALTKLNTLGRMSSRIARDYQRALRTLAEIRKCKNEPSLALKLKETKEEAPPISDWIKMEGNHAQVQLPVFEGRDTGGIDGSASGPLGRRGDSDVPSLP